MDEQQYLPMGNGMGNLALKNNSPLLIIIVVNQQRGHARTGRWLKIKIRRQITDNKLSSLKP